MAMKNSSPGGTRALKPPLCRPLRCSRLRVVVLVPSSRVRPSSIVTLSPSRGWWPAGQLESSSHRPQNWRASWKEKDPERFKTHVFPPFGNPACQERSRRDDNATLTTFPMGPNVKGWRDIGVREVHGFQKCPSQFGVASCSILINKRLAAVLAAESLQVSWCVSLSASQKAELHINSWHCQKNSLWGLELKHTVRWAILCFPKFFKGSPATHPHLERHSYFQILF